MLLLSAVSFVGLRSGPDDVDPLPLALLHHLLLVEVGELLHLQPCLSPPPELIAVQRVDEGTLD